MRRIFNYRHAFVSCVFTLLLLPARAQKTSFAMQPQVWQYDTARTEFIQYLGVPAVQGKGNKSLQVFLKDKVFTNGTIEFDVALQGQGFPGINFRMSGDQKNGDNFYLRAFGDFNPLTRTTLQYAAIIDGLSMWDLTDEYQAGATLHPTGWNHVKLVVSGLQMRAYVNDMDKPALIVPRLESGRTAGGISLTGNVVYANLTIDAQATEGLSPAPGYDATYNDTRYLRSWQYTGATSFPAGMEPVIRVPSASMSTLKPGLPDSSTVWTPIKAEARAMVNLSRVLGSPAKGGERRLCWLKTTIHADSAQDRQLALGFSDEVWVFINGQILYVDKNYFGTPQQKYPNGRCTIENTSFKLPLKKGDNEVLIALANYFYGWGIIARLDNTEGLHY